MLRKRPLALALVLLGVALLAPARPLAAQLTEGVLAPAGRLRFEVTPTPSGAGHFISGASVVVAGAGAGRRAGVLRRA